MEQQNNISNNTDDTGKMNQNTRIFLFFLLAIILVGLIIVFGVCFWQKYFSKRVGDPIVNVAEKEYAQKQIKQIADPVLDYCFKHFDKLAYDKVPVINMFFERY